MFLYGYKCVRFYKTLPLWVRLPDLGSRFFVLYINIMYNNFRITLPNLEKYHLHKRCKCQILRKTICINGANAKSAEKSLTK